MRQSFDLSVPSGNTLKEFKNYGSLLISKHEKKIEWTKQGLIKLFDEVNTLKMKTSVNTDEIKLHFHDKGTPINKFVPLIKTEFVYSPQFSMDQVIRALHNYDERVKWDSNLLKKYVVKKMNRVEIVHEILKPHAIANQKRDILEKKIGFPYRPMMDGPETPSDSFHSTSFRASANSVENYFFFSSMDSKESRDLLPAEPDVVRTHVYFGMHKFEFIQVPPCFQGVDKALHAQENMCVKSTFLLQCDAKLSKIKMGLYKTALPKLTKSFYESLNGYLEKNL